MNRKHEAYEQKQEVSEQKTESIWTENRKFLKRKQEVYEQKQETRTK